MRRKLYMIVFLLAVAMGTSARQASWLTHVPGINSLGVRTGTGWGNGVTVGLTYNYYFHRSWSVTGGFDYEWGRFDRSDLHSLTLRAGVEGAVWHPVQWCFLHLTGGALGCYDMWRQRDLRTDNNGWGVGCYLGVNAEFYVKPNLSLVAQAEQSWRYTWLGLGGYNYFSPVFGIGVRYNIR